MRRNQSKVCLAAKDFPSSVFNDQFEITGLFQSPMNDKAIELVYRDKEATAEEPRNTNVLLRVSPRVTRD